MRTSNDERGAPLAREVGRLADAIGRLIREHVELARVELRRDARRWAADGALLLVALPLLFAALLLLDAALALGLGSWLGVHWGFAIVGLLNLVAGTSLAAAAAARLRRRDGPLAETSEELRRNRLLAEQIRQDLREERGPLPPASIRPYGDGGATAT